MHILLKLLLGDFERKIQKKFFFKKISLFGVYILKKIHQSTGKSYAVHKRGVGRSLVIPGNKTSGKVELFMDCLLR